MPLGLSYPHIEKAEGESARLKRLPRIRVAQLVMDHLSNGWSAEEILRQHSYLLPAEVYSALAYYFDHREEIDREIRAEWECAESDALRAPPSPFYTRMKAKGLL